MESTEWNEQIEDPREARFAAALLDGATVAEAGELVGVSTRQAYRWRDRPQIRSALREGVRRTLDGVTAKLASASSMAVDVLTEMMADPSASRHVRTRAAAVVLSSASKAIDRELDERLDALEAELGDERPAH